MTNLIAALTSYMKASGTGMRGFIGSYYNEYGPFMGVAKEGTSFPYTTYTVLPSSMDQGFDTVYVEKVIIRFQIFAESDTLVAGYLTTLKTKLDTISNSDLTITNGTLRGVLRKSSPMIFPQPVAGKGQRIYTATVDYEFRVQQTKGTS